MAKINRFVIPLEPKQRRNIDEAARREHLPTATWARQKLLMEAEIAVKRRSERNGADAR